MKTLASLVQKLGPQFGEELKGQWVAFDPDSSAHPSKSPAGKRIIVPILAGPSKDREEVVAELLKVLDPNY